MLPVKKNPGLVVEWNWGPNSTGKMGLGGPIKGRPHFIVTLVNIEYLNLKGKL